MATKIRPARLFAFLGLILFSAGCVTVPPNSAKTRDGSRADIHPIVHRHGTPPRKPRFDLPDMSGISRHDWYLARFPWLARPVSGKFEDTSLVEALDLMLPRGIGVRWGDMGHGLAKLDRYKKVSEDFRRVTMYDALRQMLSDENLDFIPGSRSITIARYSRLRYHLPVPNVMNTYTGMVGNMLSNGGTGGGFGGMQGGYGGMQGGYGGMQGGYGGMQGGYGGMQGGYGGMQGGAGGGNSSSSGLVLVNAMSGWVTFWQDLTGTLNGLASGRCSPAQTSSGSPMSAMTGGAGGMSGGYGGAGGGYGAVPYAGPTPGGYATQ
ncbi:MAG: hypothetical protein ACYDBP_04330 [Leptospirales bacterium]